MKVQAVAAIVCWAETFKGCDPVQRRMTKVLVAVFAAVTGLINAGSALSQSAPVIGVPYDRQIGLQEASTEMGRQINQLFNFGLTPLITLIVLFVTALLVWVMFRYNEKANPTPSKVTHNTTLEIVWIAIPTIIVMVLLVFAWRLMFFIDAQPMRPGLVVTVVGKQWKWGYEYDRYMPADDYRLVASAEEMMADGGDDSIDIATVGEYVELDGFVYDSCSNIGCGIDSVVNTLGDGLELAAVDNHLVIPSGTKVSFQVVADDVGHSFAVPSFGIKMDAWPGRTNHTWTEVDPGKEGIYIGQCSEICGEGHAYMPIVIEVVTPAQFDVWVEAAAEVVISSGGTKAPPSVQDVLGENYWGTQTAMLRQ